MRSAVVFVLVAAACGGNAASTSTQTPREAASGAAKNGWLDPHVIQSVTRKNFGAFARCYNDALRGNPHLRGRVTTRFVIDLDGTVPMVANEGSDMPDENVVRCVVSHFRDLRFPEPQGGRVTVVYPIQFTPGDADEADAGADAQ